MKGKPIYNEAAPHCVVSISKDGPIVINCQEYLPVHTLMYLLDPNGTLKVVNFGAGGRYRIPRQTVNRLHYRTSNREKPGREAFYLR